MTVKEERQIHRLNDKLGVSSDGDRNILLYEWYEKQEGKGLNAPKTGEWAWRPYNNGTYFTTPKSMGYRLFNKDFIASVGEVGLDEERLMNALDAKLKEYQDYFESIIVLELAKVKGKSVEEE